MQGDRAWQGLLVAAPVVAWSKYAIPSGTIERDEAETIRVHLRAHVLAREARVALVPYLYSIDQLPRHFSELRRLAARLADAALTGEEPRLDFTRLPETANLLADTRFLVITHHALTMSRMHRLFGVTMAERGVSQLVSVSLSEAERVAAE